MPDCGRNVRPKRDTHKIRRYQCVLHCSTALCQVNDTRARAYRHQDIDTKMDHGELPPKKKKKTKKKAVAFEEPAAQRQHPQSQKRREEEIGWGAFCDSLELDRRLARAVAQLGWTRPSLVQKATLPVALSGRDCLVRARTGSGKTACYALPILQKVLRDKASASDARKAYNGVRALVLLPTRELVAQARRQLLELAAYCRESVTVVALRGDSRATMHCPSKNQGDIVRATPAAAREAPAFTRNKAPPRRTREHVRVLRRRRGRPSIRFRLRRGRLRID